MTLYVHWCMYIGTEVSVEELPYNDKLLVICDNKWPGTSCVTRVIIVGGATDGVVILLHTKRAQRF